MANLQVTVRRQFDLSPERLFEAWLNPAGAGNWLFGTSFGQIVRTEIDARVGGTFVITDRRDGEDVEHTGEYLEIERPHRLIFTFGVLKYGPYMSLVTVEITPRGAGCEMAVTQEVPPDMADMAERVREGWSTMLETLAGTCD